MTTYTTTLTRASQITLPKALQQLLEVSSGDRLVYTYDEKTKALTLKRQATLSERLEALHNSYSKTTKNNLKKFSKKYSGMSVSEIRAAWDNSKEGKRYYAEKYGVKNA